MWHMMWSTLLKPVAQEKRQHMYVSWVKIQSVLRQLYCTTRVHLSTNYSTFKKATQGSATSLSYSNMAMHIMFSDYIHFLTQLLSKSLLCQSESVLCMTIGAGVVVVGGGFFFHNKWKTEWRRLMVWWMLLINQIHYSLPQNNSIHTYSSLVAVTAEELWGSVCSSSA